MDKSVSIVAPAYNHEAFIQKALWSVAKQDFCDMELIVIDDCSKDKTLNLIEKLLDQEEFVRAFKGGVRLIHHKENKGAHFSLNEGIEVSKGKYISILNTDDYFGTGRLNLLVNAMEENNSMFSFGGIQSVDEHNQPIVSGYGVAIMKYQETAKRCPTITMALTRGNSTISTGNMIFTKELYKKLGGFRKYRYVHDWDFALRAALITEPIFIPEALYYYRLHTHNTISEISQNAVDANTAETNGGKEEILENPLVDFLKHILCGEFENTKIPSKDVWDYFFKYKKYFDDDDESLWAWQEAKAYTRIKI